MAHCTFLVLLVLAIATFGVIEASTILDYLRDQLNSQQQLLAKLENSPDQVSVHEVYVSGGAYAELTSSEVACQAVKRDCLDLYLNGCKTDGVYLIDPTQTGRVIRAYCDMTYNGGGWTVIQRRVDDSVNFYRDFGSYVEGFGNLGGNMWLGLDSINKLTTSTDELSELYVYLESFENEERFAKYSNFYIDGSADLYKLHISGYYGTAGDGFTFHNNMMFSTYDHDSDATTNHHCARKNHGAWWYNSCQNCNLNGLYLAGEFTAPIYSGIVYNPWKGHSYSLKTSTMKIRRHSNLVEPSTT